MVTKTKKSHPTQEEALEQVRLDEQRTMGRRERQDLDYRQYRREGYNTNTDADGTPTGADFRSFTGNEAKAYAKKVVAMLSASELLIQVPYGQADKVIRKLYDIKERFAYGIIEMANDALAESWTEPGIHDQFAWYAPHRGFIITKHLFFNKEDGTSDIEIRPWDARTCSWRNGRGGLLWACNRNMRTVGDILAEYPKAGLTGDDDEELAVYDYYNREFNAVFTDDVMLKDWIEHGASKVPISVVAVPFAPPLWSETIKDITTDYGESIFAENRGLFSAVDEVMSITLELMAKSREPSSIVYTDEEDTELEEDPNERGGVHYLGQKDKFEQLRNAETSKDAMQFMQMLTGMIQRGGLPYSAYGELQFAISGYAITQLNQQILTVLAPQVKAMSIAYKLMITSLLDQFVEGKFNTFSLRGFNQNKDYMQLDITPGLLENLPPYKVKVVAQLPQDDIAILTAVQNARGGENPLLPDRYLLDEYLKVPDANLIDRMRKEQASEIANPRAFDHVLAEAAGEAGRPELMKIWLDQLELDTLQSFMEKVSIQVQAIQMGLDPGSLQGVGGAEGGGPASPQGAPGVNSALSPAIAATGLPNGGTPPIPQGAGRPQGAPRNVPSNNPTNRALAPQV